MSKARVDTIATYDDQDQINVSELVQMKTDLGNLQNTAVQKTSSTGAAIVPKGTEAQRPDNPYNGLFRYNETTNQFEGYINGSWGSVGGGDHVLSIKWEQARTLIAVGSAPLDGQLLNRATYPDAWTQIQASGLLITDTEWLADPTKRGMYSSGNGTTTFRLPDLNGKFAGSLGAVFQRGDGALSAAVAGVIQSDALQGHKHSTTLGDSTLGGGAGVGFGTESTQSTSIVGQTYSSSYKTLTSTSNVNDGTNGTPRTAAETRPLNVTGVWVVKLFGSAINQGSVDVQQLATDYANLVSTFNSLPIKKEYTSSQLSITSAGTVTLTHNLGSAPKMVSFSLVCAIAEQGYSVGDVLEGIGFYSSANLTFQRGIALVPNSTEIFCRYGSESSVFGHLNKSNGTYVAFTNANWRVVVRAWA